MPGKKISYLICFVFSFFFLKGLSLYSQHDAHLDSLENAIEHAEGTHKADLMIKSFDYQWEVARTLGYADFINASRSIYQYSKSIFYTFGMAEGAKFLAHGFGGLNEPDSSRYYLSESLRLYTEINDSTNMARMYGTYARTERGDGNYELALRYTEKQMELARIIHSVYLQIEAYENLVDIYKVLGEFSLEEQSYKKILELQASINMNSSRNLISLGRYYVNHGEYEKGILYCRMADSAIAILDNVYLLEFPDRTFMQAKMKGMVARAYRLWGYYDSALVWYRMASGILKSFTGFNNVDLPNQWEGIGFIYTQWGMYDSSRFYLENSAALRGKYDDWLGVGESYDGLGYLYWLIGDEETSVKYYRDAIEMKFKIPLSRSLDRMTTLKESQSVSYLGLGQAYASWQMPESAGREFEKSIGLCRETGYRQGEAEVMVEFGKLSSLQGNRELASDYFHKALQIFKEIQHKPGQASALQCYGDLFFSVSEYDKALDYYRQAENLSLQTRNPIEITNTWYHIGVTLAKMNHYDEAISILEKSLSQASRLRLYKTLMDANKALADILEASGKLKEALRHYEVYVSMKDSINRQNTFYLLADLESKYKADLDQKQVELLSKDATLKELSLSWSKAILFGTMGLILMLIALSVLLLRVNRLKVARRLAILQQNLFHSKMNPEFIFRSLENIRYFVERSESKKAVDYLSGFSRLMQYILESSRKDFILLDKAIIMMKNYLQLHELINNEPVEYNVEIDDSLDPDEKMIPPMMIQPLIEGIIVPETGEDISKRHLKIGFKNNGPTILIIVETDWLNTESSVLQAKEPASFSLIRDRLKTMEKKFKRKLVFECSDILNENGDFIGKKWILELPAVEVS